LPEYPGAGLAKRINPLLDYESRHRNMIGAKSGEQPTIDHLGLRRISRNLRRGAPCSVGKIVNRYRDRTILSECTWRTENGKACARAQ
jgi:hypothetical protein